MISKVPNNRAALDAEIAFCLYSGADWCQQTSITNQKKTPNQSVQPTSLRSATDRGRSLTV